MSKIFYDHLINVEKVDKEIRKITESHEERSEFWQIIDEIIHHRMFGCIFDKLPREHHSEFLERFYKAPHDEGLLIFLSERIKEDISLLLKYEAKKIEHDLMDLLVEGKKNLKKAR